VFMGMVVRIKKTIEIIFCTQIKHQNFLVNTATYKV